MTQIVVNASNIFISESIKILKFGGIRYISYLCGRLLTFSIKNNMRRETRGLSFVCEAASVYELETSPCLERNYGKSGYYDWH